MANGPVSPGAAALTSSDLFTSQEQAFLRHYSDALVRLDALIAAGYVASPPDLATHQGLLAQAGELIGRAERLSLSAIASAIGGDKVAFLAVLWKQCQSDNAHAAIKALALLARIHGAWDKESTIKQQVALVFTQAKAAPGTTPPASLPFTLPSGQYQVFPQGDTENDPEP